MLPPIPQRGETVEPLRVTMSLVVFAPSGSLSCLYVVLAISALLALSTTLYVDLCRSIVVVVVEIKTNALLAGVVNDCGILFGSTPGVKTGGSVTLNRISPAVGIQAMGIPDPLGQA